MRRTFDFEWFKVKWLAGYGWVLDRPAAVVVMPVGPDDRLWLARVHRVPTKTTSWEAPGGAIDGAEDIVEAGLRELAEECSLVAREGGRLLRMPLELAPGMGAFPHHIVIASGVVPRGRHPKGQREEGITAVRAFDRAQIGRMIRTGAIHVGATLAALAMCGWLESARR